MRSVVGRIVWLLLLPLFLVQIAMWIVGILLEQVGDALQQGADSLRTELLRWGRVLFCVTSRRE